MSDTTTAPRRPRRRPKLAESKVLRRRDVTEDLWSVWIEKPEGFTFKPGQYCTIGVDGIERAYSIVSAPHEDDLELFIELVPRRTASSPRSSGSWGPATPSPLGRGRRGSSYSSRRLPNHLFVATVTGVVPYVSILRDYIHHGRSGHRFHVLMGASYVDEFTYDAELIDLARERPDLVTFVPTVSRPDEDRNSAWEGKRGRVNEIVEEYAEAEGLTPDDTIVYACGHPGMIEDVKARFIPRGFQVEEERFWKDD